MKPGAEARLALETRERRVGSGEDLLRDVEGILAVSDHLVRKVECPVLVAPDQSGKGLAVPPLSPVYQLPIVFRLRLGPFRTDHPPKPWTRQTAIYSTLADAITVPRCDARKNSGAGRPARTAVNASSE